jgi:cation/acetate symporter
MTGAAPGMLTGGLSAVPADIHMKMLGLHAPESLGLKQEYIQEQQAAGH